MRSGRATAVLLAAAILAACGHHDQLEPCAFAAAGAAWIAFTSEAQGSWDVEVIRADGTCRRALTGGGSRDLHPAWGSGGLLAYDSDRAPGPGLWVHDVSSGAERRIDLAGDLGATSPAFSPDGATLAFEGRMAGTTDGSIYLVPVAGGTPRLLTPDVPGSATPHPSGNGGPAFSSDGATVYFVSNRAGPYDVFRVPVAGGEAVRITAGSGIVGRPAVSPDGRTLAYARSAGGSTEVVRYDLATGTVTPVAAGASEPAFDPAGGRLAIRAERLLASAIELVALDGGSAAPVTTGPGPDAGPAFAR